MKAGYGGALESRTGIPGEHSRGSKMARGCAAWFGVRQLCTADKAVREVNAWGQ